MPLGIDVSASMVSSDGACDVTPRSTHPLSMYKEWIHEVDAAELEEWDAFVMRSHRGHYCQLSTWLRSFGTYGFRFQILTVRAEKTTPIIGGFGCLLVGLPGLRVLSCAVGPIVDSENDDLVKPILEEVLRHSWEQGICAVQVQMPCNSTQSYPFLIEEVQTDFGVTVAEGMPVRIGTAPHQILWIDLIGSTDGGLSEDEVFNTFSTSTRRNIRYGQRRGIETREVSSDAELRAAFSLIERNGRTQGYATRRWEEFGAVLIEQVRQKQAVVMTAWHEGRLVGANYGVLAGNRFSYVMGGTERLTPDIKVGYVLQWAAIQKAKSLGLIGYDFTSWGSDGVRNFKMGFNPVHVPFRQARYFILRPERFVLFKGLSNLAQKHKRRIARILTTSRRFRKGQWFS